MPRNKAWYIIFFIWFAFACSGNKDNADKRVARVGDKYLYLSEVEDFVPNGVSTSDSTLMAEDYIKKWIQKELLIKKAEENLTPAQKDVAKEIEEYRNSLIIYKYKNELLAQKMDTVVSAQAIEDYYNEHKETFILNRNIVRAVFLKVPVEVANPDQLKLYCENKTDENFQELKEYCLQYAKSFDTFNDSWVGFSLVLNNIPEQIENQDRFLARNSFLEKSDSVYYYLVCIRDYKLAGQPAPVEYVSDQIKNLLLNKRKQAFLKKIEQDIYNEGMRNNKFDIYDVEK